MTRIWHVDHELGYAVIETGVTYKQLSDHLKAHCPTLWSDSAGTTQYASVLGNALDKGRGLTPYADHFGSLCGMDVVLPDGALLETGGGSRHWQPRPAHLQVGRRPLPRRAFCPVQSRHRGQGGNLADACPRALRLGCL